ncbi:SDR family NAD(P)-dependent oxidoreductase [Blastococcus atacamensis]|uniref:SDR family NAD(P)-dependent oxidoreductase n=1 Tax=Blastococcus atacamensis TaxID=2070508 RepID=UPI000CEBACB3|nr:SDR family NAD(P)-dependent oxidoreductase [Blastococcus atacamensis]
MNLTDRSILLTGAGGGIGRSLALQLSAFAPRLTLVGRRAEPLEEVASLVRDRGGQAHVVAADLGAPEAPARVVAAAQEHFGGIDVLVNNAGNVRAGRLAAIEESEVVAQIALNLTAPILLTRAALPALRASGDGLVVNVSSGIGLVGMPFYATYAATKAGIAHFGEALRREMYGEGVHVLTVYPGATSTPMMASSQAGPEHGFVYETPDEVAAATVAGMTDGSLSVVRGGERRRQMIDLNRNDPGALDRQLAEGKTELEQAVTGHSSL